MRGPPAMALLVCVAALVASGCGGGSDANDFRREYNAIARQYASLPTAVGKAVREAGTKSAKELAHEFADLAGRLAAEVRKLKELDAPDEASDEFRALVAGLAKVEDDLHEIAVGAGSRSPRRVTEAARALVRHSEQVSRDEDALKKAVDPRRRRG